jgi:phospholipid/cholesterol/gamma-HCH transport system substrate-binding protein
VAEWQAAFNGLSRLSQILGNQSGDIATIVSQGAGLTSVLSQRSGQLFNLVGQADIVLQVLEQRRASIKSLLDGTSALSQQLSSFLSTNSSQLTTLFNNLQSVSAVLAQNANNLGQAIPVLAALAKYTANATGSGPFVDATIPTLLIPDNIFKQCSAPNAFPSRNPQVGCRP